MNGKLWSCSDVLAEQEPPLHYHQKCSFFHCPSLVSSLGTIRWESFVRNMRARWRQNELLVPLCFSRKTSYGPFSLPVITSLRALKFFPSRCRACRSFLSSPTLPPPPPYFSQKTSNMDWPLGAGRPAQHTSVFDASLNRMTRLPFALLFGKAFDRSRGAQRGRRSKYFPGIKNAGRYGSWWNTSQDITNSTFTPTKVPYLYPFSCPANILVSFSTWILMHVVDWILPLDYNMHDFNLDNLKFWITFSRMTASPRFVSEDALSQTMCICIVLHRSVLIDVLNPIEHDCSNARTPFLLHSYFIDPIDIAPLIRQSTTLLLPPSTKLWASFSRRCSQRFLWLCLSLWCRKSWLLRWYIYIYICLVYTSPHCCRFSPALQSWFRALRSVFRSWCSSRVSMCCE